MTRIPFLGAFATISLLAGASDPRQQGQQSPARARDSAGVRIIETSARARAPINFQLGAIILDLGGLKPNPDDEFSAGAVLRTLRFSDGSIVASDEGKLRLYDLQGNQKKVVGRMGEGPNEFQRLGTICITRGDTLIAGDDGNRRFTILDKSGMIVNQFPVGRGDLLSHACLDDGTFFHIEGTQGANPALRRLIRRRTTGAIVDTVLIPAPPTVLNMYIIAENNVTVRRNHIYSSDQEHSQVRVYDLSGKLTTIIRTNDPAERITDAQLAGLQPLFSGIGSAAPNSRLLVRPELWPGFRGMDVDENGRIWLEDYPRNRTSPLTWTAIDPDGAIVGKFSIAPSPRRGDARVRFFMRDAVMIRKQDNDGAERIITYRLVTR